MRTVDAANGYWGEILSKHIDSKFLKNKHGECPLCGGKDRYRYDNKGGHGTSYCSQCGARSGMQLLMDVTGWEFREAANEIDKMLGNTALEKDIPQAQDKSKILGFIRSKLINVQEGDTVDRYLKIRGINEYNSKYFRLIKNFDYRQGTEILGKADCMAAVITDKDNQRIGYHLTYITTDGKADFPSAKKIFGNLSGGSIKFGLPKNGVLAVTEGIENALAVTQTYGHTCWATVSAEMMKQFEIPEGLTHLIIHADNDKSFTGQEAAYTLAKRAVLKGLEVMVDVPEKKGYDFLDRMTLE